MNQRDGRDHGRQGHDTCLAHEEQRHGPEQSADGCKAGEEAPTIADAEEKPDGNCKLGTKDSETNKKAGAPLIVLLEPLKRQATEKQEQNAVLTDDDGEKDRKKREERERARVPRERKGRVTWAPDVGKAEEDAIDRDGCQVCRTVAQQGERNEEQSFERGMVERLEAERRRYEVILDGFLKAEIIEVRKGSSGEMSGGIKSAEVLVTSDSTDERDA